MELKSVKFNELQFLRQLSLEHYSAIYYPVIYVNHQVTKHASCRWQGADVNWNGVAAHV